MGYIITIISIVMGLLIPIVAIITTYLYNAKKLQLENNREDTSELRKQIGYLLAQQEETDEKIKQLQYLLSQNNSEKGEKEKREIISPIELPDRLKNPKDFDRKA